MIVALIMSYTINRQLANIYLIAVILLGCVLMIVFYVVWAILHLMKLMGRDTSKEEEGLNR